MMETSESASSLRSTKGPRASRRDRLGPGARRQPSRPGYIRRREARFAWSLVSPSLIVLFLVTTLPFLALIVLSLMRIDLTGSKTGFSGIGNFRHLVSDPQFFSSLLITILYTVVTVALQIVLGLALALWFLRLAHGKRALTVAVVLPMILAPVVVGLAWQTFLLTPKYGLVDYLAQLVGLGSQSWLTNPTLALICVIAVHTWQWTPFAFLVFLANLHGMPSDVVEAARVDGAGPWQVVRWILLPLLTPAMVIVAVIRMVWALRAFDAILAMTGGGPGTATQVLNLYIYDVAFSQLNIGYAATLALVLLIISAGASWFFFRWSGSVRN